MIQNFFVHKHNVQINIYIWTPTPITLPRSRCACGVIRNKEYQRAMINLIFDLRDQFKDPSSLRFQIL